VLLKSIYGMVKIRIIIIIYKSGKAENANAKNIITAQYYYYHV